MMHIFKSKAETLRELEGTLTNAKILPQVSATVEAFRENPNCLWQEAGQPIWLSKPVIVRSSSLAEDNAEESNAGKFESIPNVMGKEQIVEAINSVIKSYGQVNNNDQFFVQPMLPNVSVSGVAFSKDPNNGGHYYVINYDDQSASTDSVTSGTSNELKLTYIAKQSKLALKNQTAQKVFNLLSELENRFPGHDLDIEFAIDKRGQLYLFQLRPLSSPVDTPYAPSEQFNCIQHAAKRFKQMSKRHPYLLGQKAVFGIMPDWNPAEIIGTKPKPLSISLYRELITDNIWAYQRDNYGYRKLRSFPLMVDFFGMPYIDARISFNSFIPADLDEVISEKLVNYYLDSLEKRPFLHDKVEFDIVFSCYSFDLKNRINILKKHGFTSEEVEKLFISLRKLSNKIIGNNGLWRADIEKISELETRQSTILDSELSYVEKIYWLIEDCKRYGTLPFAGLARAGFIAVQMLESMVNTDILSGADKEQFLRSLDTISSSLSEDFQTLSQQSFLGKYGHLRPGTYDILSPRYDEEPSSYFDWKKEKVTPAIEEKDFAVTIDSLNKLNAVLERDGIDLDAIGTFNFIRAAIEGREYAKFVFTKSLSNVLSLVGLVGEESGITKEDLSYLDINILKENYISARDIAIELKRNIETGKEKYQMTKMLRLPPLLVSEQDFWAFDMPSNQPNYITQKCCSGKVLSYTKDKHKLGDKIVFIENADPGYDWIFSCDIKGFVTQYGGINSHMAIRASELGIPAVIGAGEALFKQWLNAEYLEIDCANKTVRPAC